MGWQTRDKATSKTPLEGLINDLYLFSESQVDPDEINKWEEQRQKTAGSVLTEIDEGSEDDDDDDNNDHDSVNDVDEQYECQDFKEEGDKENRHLNEESSMVDVETEKEKTAAHNVKDAKKENPTKKPKRSDFKVIRSVFGNEIAIKR